MEDMNDLLGSLMSDPESMQQIKELADMFKSEDPQHSDGGTSSTGGFDFSSLAGILGGLGGGDNSDGIGINADMIGAIGKIMSAMNGEDKNRTLLLALRPHLSEQRQLKLDKAVKMLKIYSAANALKDSGMLNNLDKLI